MREIMPVIFACKLFIAIPHITDIEGMQTLDRDCFAEFTLNPVKGHNDKLRIFAVIARSVSDEAIPRHTLLSANGILT
jgi:hypothetical protein